jgi:hypothetical protein
VRSLKEVGIDFEVDVAESGEQIFTAGDIESISIGAEIPTPLTDVWLDIERSDSFAWAFSDALLHTIHEAHPDAVLGDRLRAHTAMWAQTIGRIPRVAPFRDKEVAEILADWMKKFASVTVDEWIAGHCFTPYSSTEAVLMLYNPAPVMVYAALACAGLMYGILVFMAIAKHKILGTAADVE